MHYEREINSKFYSYSVKVCKVHIKFIVTSKPLEILNLSYWREEKQKGKGILEGQTFVS